MTDREDTFTRFLAVLGRHLDDHTVASGDLAAEMFLSRSHFDRVMGALAGETPARFRRRVLLERAAFRLRTADISILDAAVEAGYGSHEAFTRAFRRAYGESPATWRTSAGALYVASPNGVHFFPPNGLRLAPRKQVDGVNLVAGMVDHHLAILRQLLGRADTLSNGELDAPLQLPFPAIDREPSIRSILSRLVGQMDMWMAAMASQPYDFAIEQGESTESMRARLDRAGGAFAEYVRQVSAAGRFDETYVDATGATPYVFTAAGMVTHVLTYAAYRRTLLVCALAAIDATDVDDDPLTWFAPAG